MNEKMNEFLTAVFPKPSVPAKKKTSVDFLCDPHNTGRNYSHFTEEGFGEAGLFWFTHSKEAAEQAPPQLCSWPHSPWLLDGLGRGWYVVGRPVFLAGGYLRRRGRVPSEAGSPGRVL